MKQTFRFLIPWWLPFAYFAPSMVLFFLYPLTATPWLNASLDWWGIMIFASLNFILGYIGLALRSLRVEEAGLVYVAEWRRHRIAYTSIQKVESLGSNVVVTYQTGKQTHTRSFPLMDREKSVQSIQSHL